MLLVMMAYVADVLFSVEQSKSNDSTGSRNR
jgi:hypothetical protein